MPMPDCVRSCLLRRALRSHNVDVTNCLLSCLNLTFGILPRMRETSCRGSASFAAWWPPNSPILLRLWPAAEACKASIIQVLDLHQTRAWRAWHWRHRYVSRKAVFKCEPKKATSLPPLNGPVPIGVRCPCQTVWCLACSEELSEVIMSMQQIASFGILPRMRETSCRGSA